MADIESASAMGFAELGTFHGVVFAGLAGGRGGGAGCHNGDCTRPGRVKKAVASGGRPFTSLHAEAAS